MNGEKTYRCRWSKNDIARINALFLACYALKPLEIHRGIRILADIHYWKGTEFRTVLMYVGAVVFKNILPTDEYNHFIKLVCAVSICSTNKHRAYVPKAREYFNEFIEEAIDIYGIHSINYNLHNLCHIADDVEKFGELSGISAYPFENMLYQVKLMVKPGRYPLSQLIRRLSEQTKNNVIDSFENIENIKPVLENPFILPPNGKVFGKITFTNDKILSTKIEDQWFLSTDDDIVMFKYAIVSNNIHILCGRALSNKTDFFTYPFSSKYINIFKANINDNGIDKFYKIQQMKAKLFCMPFENEFVFFPLLHTL